MYSAVCTGSFIVFVNCFKDITGPQAMTVVTIMVVVVVAVVAVVVEETVMEVDMVVAEGVVDSKRETLMSQKVCVLWFKYKNWMNMWVLTSGERGLV